MKFRCGEFVTTFLRNFLPLYVSYRVRQITSLALIPSNHLEVVQILRKPQTVKTWALLQRTLSAILLVLIRLVSSRHFLFTLLPFKATVEPKLTNISSKRTLPSDPVTCLLHSSQGLVGNTEQAKSAREGWWEWAQSASWKQLFLISTVPAYRRLTAAVYMEGGRF